MVLVLVLLLVMQTMPQYAVLVPALVLFGVGDHAAVIITMWMSEDGSKVILATAIPYDGKTASHGNGTMKAIPLDSHEAVDEMYSKAIELGATDDGEPGPRAGNFYGAYVYDLDGNKLCFFNF